MKPRGYIRKIISHISIYFFFLCFNDGRDTITITTPLRDNGETLVSAGKIFELGFFSPNTSNNGTRYIGIWYYSDFDVSSIVWIANRDDPILERSGVLSVDGNGNIQLSDKNERSYWNTTASNGRASTVHVTVQLMDSGNFVLKNSLKTWQSFDSPTDTFLPGMTMNDELKLTSWKSPNDPGKGNFSFQRDEEATGQFNIRNNLTRYWRSGVSGKFIPSDSISLLNTDKFSRDCFVGPRGTVCQHTSAYRRLVLSYTGEIQYMVRSGRIWNTLWSEPKDNCSVYNVCGKYGICNINNGLRYCKCLPGFEPSSPNQWFSGDFSGGCTRKPSCENTFLSLKLKSAGKPDNRVDSQSMENCKDQCANSGDCKAYSYQTLDPRDSNSGRICWIWTEDLNNLQEEEGTGGHNMSVRVGISYIESTRKNCDPCGTNLIPYPLSTSQSCGDPMYSSFHCNNETKQVSFDTTRGATFRVTSINPATQTLTILTDNCSQDLGDFNSISSPFKVKSRCSASQNILSSDMVLIYRDELEIGWTLLHEPICNSSNDCNDWPNSSCNVSSDGQKRCLCSPNFIWNGTSANCTQDIFSSTKGSPKKSRLIIVVAFGSVFLLLCIISTIICFFHKRMDPKSQETRENTGRNQATLLYDHEKHVKEFIESSGLTEEDKGGIDVPFFDMETILIATDNFSENNKLGQGGFGPVYKGLFRGGQEIAVKRLLSSSNQGLEQFKNEVVLIAKLQHRNLVRLLGYCVEGNEMILLYEYMPNKSLDFFIFDETRGMILDWKKRFDIILGVARGLLYLHQDSRLKIIHRDLKTSNILLDEEMNPKISDFGLARIFESKQIDAATQTIVGTYGYMSPEYATEGFFSVKSDVFSFGVVLLEIISGKRNMGLYRSEQSLSLLGYAFKLWTEHKGLDLMDASLRGTLNMSEFLKCLNVGLLCVQEDPNDRPAMSNIVFMLGSENVMLTTPKQPAFVLRRGSSTTSTSTNYHEISNTLEVGR